MVSMHNSFSGNAIWADFGRGADRLGLDQHMYLVFQDQLGPDPSQFANAPCENWARGTNETSASFGPNNAGEFSAAVNDCGHWVTGVGLGTRFEGTYDGFEGRGIGQCDYWNDYRLWDDATKQTMLTYVSGAMDALQNYFFWTWKIGNSTNAALPQPNAMWHYRLGLQQGWIPEDPRSVVGHCIAAGVEPYEFYTYTAPGMTGADPNAQIQTGQFTWPPANFTDVGAGQMSSLPQYTPTATPVTLPGPTHTPPGKQEAFDFGSGWYKANDNARREFAPIAGCTYMNEYQAATMAIPAGACGAGLAQPTRRSVDERNFPAPTAAPARR
jgi:glucan 1,3-beta-glucosidase